MSSKYFSRKELECKCGCGKADVSPVFLEKLDRLRESYGRPIVLSSAYRCPDHNSSVSSTGRSGPHATGRAVDIRCSGKAAYEILSLAMQSSDFKGIGISQKGNHQARFIHLDDVTEGNRPWIWSY